jgi:hypothetical protein
LKKIIVTIICICNFLILNAQVFGSLAADDYDAAVFMKSSAANLSIPKQKDALNILTKTLKVYGLWSKMTAIYPIIGGNSISHSFNLRNTSLYQITWVGSPTHDANGVDWNGSSQYGNTNFVANSSLTNNNSVHLSYYSRENTTVGVDDISAYNTTTGYISRMLIKDGSTSRFVSDQGANAVDRIDLSTISDSRGLFVSSRTSSTAFDVYRNGVNFGTRTATNSVTGLPDYSYFLGALNYNGSAVNFSMRQVAFASIGTGLTSTDVNALNNAIQTYETALGRNTDTSTDPDAQSFITAAGITDNTQQNAINQLVLDLKSYGIWSKCVAIYPLVGGNASSHSFNLKNTSSYQVTWVGSPGHSSTGVQFSGSNYAITNLPANAVLNPNDFHFATYIRNSLQGYNYPQDMGIYDANNAMRLNSLSGSDYAATFNGGKSGNWVYLSQTTNNGCFVGSQRSTTDATFYRNGVNLTTNTIDNSTAAWPTQNSGYLYFGWVNPNNWPEKSMKEFAFVSIGTGLTNSDIVNLTNTIQNYEINLGRQVY